MVKVIAENGYFRIEGTFDAGYMGIYKDEQIRIESSIKEVKCWQHVNKAKKHKKCTDDDIAAYLTWYINNIEIRMHRDINISNNNFCMDTYDDMECDRIEFWKYSDLTVQEKMPENPETVYELNKAEIKKCCREYENSMYDGSAECPESFLRRLFPMFNWNNYIHSIVPEYIELNDKNIEFMCSDKYGCNTVWSIYAGLDEDLNIKEWRNSYW